MTAADLALLTAFWLLLMVLRPWLSVDPRYVGRRRAGRATVAPLVLDPPTQVIDVRPAVTYLFRLPPYIVDRDEQPTERIVSPEETGPLERWEHPTRPGTYLGGMR